jgi:hypothetical protein
VSSSARRRGAPMDYRTPEVYEYNLTASRALGADVAFEIGHLLPREGAFPKDAAC